MKRALLVALCATFIVILGAGQVLAAAYRITSNFGVRVTEQGATERVGSIIISPYEIGVDTFDPGPPAQIITVELLGNATISRTFGADYNWNGGNAVQVFDPTVLPNPAATGDYRVIAIEGNDFLTIEITASMVLPSDAVVVGHTEADGTDDSALCFNLVGTIYNANDPARQLVMVSYYDNLASTFSGDIYVATVKPKSVVVDLCAIALPTEIIEEDGVPAQGEDCGFGSGTVCMFTFEDNATGALLGDYEFTLGKTTGAKAGIGYSEVHIYKWNTVVGDWNLLTNLVSGIVERHDSNGDTIVRSDFDSDEELWTATSEIVIAATLTGPGLYRADAVFEYDTCTVQPGIWTSDIHANRVTCGGSFSGINWEVVEFIMPTAVYRITSNFGVRVIEQGATERVGSITISPYEIGVDAFDPGPPAQIITVELLGNAIISRTFGADYNWNGGNTVATFDPTVAPLPAAAGDYRVVAIEGNDFFTIEITAPMVAPSDTIVVGHTEGDGTDDSALCFNLEGTIYNPYDPARQLVMVSYADNLSNTYSGDIYVATVKPKSVVVGLCSEFLPTEIIEEDGVPAQGEDCGFGSGTVCMFTFEDNATGALLGDYEFTLGKTTGAKAGIGYNEVHIYKWDTVVGDWNLLTNLVSGIVERHDSNGDTIVRSDFDSDEELWTATSEIVITATLTGPGLYRADAVFEYDTCTVQPGIWTSDNYANRVTCGGSFSGINWEVVEFIMPPTDSDNDNLPDDLENVGCTDPTDADTDDDGIPDGIEDANQNGIVDVGETNPCSADTDGDDIQDGTEIGLTLADIGPDTDTGVFVPDADPTTTTAPLDDDSDKDGRLDGEEDVNHNGAVDGNETDPNESNRFTAMPWIPLLLFGD